MRNIVIYLILSLSVFFGACDVLEAPYFEEHDSGGPVGEDIPKNVLVLEFTGHTCKSCPKAHRTIGQLEEIYGDRVIPVAFHTGYFARTLPGDKFNTDFRTPQGMEMEIYFEFAIYPIGLVDNLDKSRLSSYSSWPSEAEALMELESVVDLSSTSSFDEETKEVEVKVILKNKVALQGEIMLAVYLVEDGIVSWQKDEDNDPLDVEDYVHNNVFRTSAGSVWGEGLSDSDCSANANVQIVKSMVLDPQWKPENCTVITYLYESETREVIQCSSELLIK